MDENVMTNEPALSTQVKNINTFLKGKGKVPCIQYFPILKPTFASPSGVAPENHVTAR